MAYFDAKADKVEKLFLDGSPVDVFKHIGAFMPKSKSASVFMSSLDGEPAKTFVDHKRHFQQYFAQLTSAATSTYSSHVDRYRSSYQQGLLAASVCGRHECRVDPSLFVSQTQLTSKFAHMKPKGLGENRLGGELFKVHPQLFSSIYHPIVTKSICSVFMPLQWVGGQVFELLKPKGS
eukprot:6380325-Karenia_brevis.AAC.1